MEADWEAALPADAAGGVDGRQPQAELAWRPRWPRPRPAASAPTSRCAASSWPAPLGYSEAELLEKWARDSKILDIFEGTQQIQQLIVARRLLGLSQRRAEVGRQAFRPAQGQHVLRAGEVARAPTNTVSTPAVGQRRRTGRAARRRCRRGYAARTPPPAVRPRSRSTRAQASSRSRPTTGRSSTVTATSARVAADVRAVPSQHRDLAVAARSGPTAGCRRRRAGRDPQGAPLAAAADDDRDVVRRPRVARGLGQADAAAPSYALVPGAHSARIVSIAASSASSRSRGRREGQRRTPRARAPTSRRRRRRTRGRR